MNTVKTEHRFSERVLAFFLVIMMFFTSMPESLFSVSAVDDEFQIFLSWNHDPENPSDTIYDSDSPEKKDIRLKISFSNKQVSKEYKPGELMITVSGMKDAVRSGDSYIPVGIAADKESDEDKHYNWSYSYTEATDTYTFTNNFTVESQSVFEGSLEIIWEIPSRETKDNFSKDFIAELFVDEKTVKSEPVTYTQKREKDTYTVEIKPSTVYDDELYVPKEERNKYTWVKYNINSGDTYLARDVKDEERFEVWFPENAVVNGGNLESTEETKDIDGKTYKKYTLKKDIQPDTEQPVIKDVIVAYPKDKYEPSTESVTVYTYLYGTYYEEETESELADDKCEIALKDYGFKDPPGDIYHVDKKSYGIHNMTIDQKYADTGAIDARHLTNGGGEYYSDLRISLNMKPHNNADITAEIIPVDYYNIEFVDDFLDIQMKDGTIEQLTDDEYHFTKIRIPPNTEVRNVNGLPIKANTYEVEIWGRVKNSESKNLDALNVKLSSDDLKITDEEQFIDLEGKNIVGVMIKINEFKESLINSADTPLVRCYYAFSLTDEKAEKVMTDGGKLFNNMFVNLYMKRTDESDVKLISGRTEDYYLGDDAERLKNRDTNIYGKLQDREKDDTPIIEIPNEFYLDSTKIVSKGNDLTNYYFEGSMTGKFTLGEDTLLEKFSMYTIIPKDLRLEEIYNDSETLLNQLQFSSSSGLSSSAIASHVKIEIIDNPSEYDGRQYIALHFDFSDNPIDVGTVSVSGIPMYIAKKDLTGGTHSYTLNGVLLVEQDGKWNSETVDNNMMEGGIWKDIDNDGDTGEPASFRSSTASIVYSEETLVSLVKYVSTPLTNGPVNPDAETATFDNAPKTYVGGEYSYWLKATVSTTKGGGGAKNIIFADVIESKTKNKSEWQGEFVGIDYSDTLSQLDYPDGTKPEPTIYYSTKEFEFEQITSTVEGETKSHNDFNSDTFKKSADWTTKKPENNKNIRAIAIDFGEGVAAPEKVLWIEIKMKAPENTDTMKQIAKNQCSVTYDKIIGAGGEETEHQGLDSNVVPVTYVQKGRVILNKKDSADGTPITGAEFELYNKSTDKKIGTYTVGGNGKLIVSNLDFGEYYFKETTAPKGYHLNKDETLNKKEFTLNAENPEISIDMENERKPGTFSIKKVSDRQPDVTLSGAVFKLYRADGTPVSDTEYTTNSDGILKLENLDWGSYYLKETKAPDGYKISDEKIEFTINADNNAGEDLETVTVKNEQIPAKVKLTKYELNMPYSDMPKSGNPVVNKNSPIKGAVYALYHEGDTPEKDKPITSRVTNDEGEIYVEDLTFGEYYFLEVSPAIGYKKYEEKISFEVTAKHTEKNVYCEITTADSRKTGNVYLLKKDNTAKGIVEANPVEGAIYRLYKFDSTKPDNFDEKKPLSVTPDSASGDGHYNYSTISGVSTDMLTCNEGFIEIHGLQWGDYILKEYKAPQGYELSNEKFEIHINKDNVSNQVILNDIDNQRLGKVKLKKVSEKDKAPLPGAKFTLYRDDGSIYADDIETTGTDGTVEVNNIPWGSYYFVEKEAPEGYGLNDKKFKFVVNYLTAGKTQEITVEDPEKNYQFTVTKKIKKSDIVFEHGNPTFIFEVKKTDGDNHVYRKTLSFSEDTTLTTGSDDYVTASVVFVVPMGTYEISEVSLNRYELEEITCSDGTATIESEKATFTVGESNQNFTFTFKNNKTDQSGTSDNGMITNTLNRSRAMIGIAAEYVGKDIVTEDVIPKEDVKVYALYDNGTKELIPETDFTLSEVNTSMPNSIQEIKVTYNKDGKNFEDKISVQIGNIVLFKYEKLTDYAAGYSGSIAITGYIGHSSVIDFPATLKVTEGGYEKTYKVLKVGNGATLTDKDNNSIFNKDIRTVTFAEGIVAIENNAFHPDNWDTANENYLQCELELPSTLKTIGNNAFKCTQITKLTIKGNNLEQIGSSAFAGCANLTGDLIIPDSVTSIGDRAFASCTKFNGTLKLPNNPNFKNIYMNTFHECKFTGKLEIPESVEKIGYGAFYAGEYSELVLHEGLKKISEPYSGDNWENCGSFADCAIDGELKIPSTVEIIGYGAFQRCNNLDSLNLSEASSLETIGYYSFYGCSGMQGNLIIPDTVKDIQHFSFSQCGFNGNLKLPNNTEFKQITQGAFKESKFTGTLTIPNTVVTIVKEAFQNCSGFTGDLIIPDSVTSIGDSAFNGCTNLNGKLQVSKNITSIGDRAFNQCDFSELFICSKELKEVKERAFYLKNNAESGTLILPIGVTYTGSWQFYNCSRVTTLYYPVEFTTLPNYKQTGIDGKTTYTDYDDLRTKLGADLAKQLGVDTW